MRRTPERCRLVFWDYVGVMAALSIARKRCGLRRTALAINK